MSYRVINDPIRYRGYYYDSETGLYYLKSRYYDPEVGRFINADGYVSTGQGILGNNMFAYCENNPVMMTDINGEDPVPSWAIHINSGIATLSEYQKALSVNSNSWGGLASVAVNNAIMNAKKQKQVVLAAEHHKKGTTNPANRKKHEDGQARKQRDNRGEKGDARRTPNPNKRRTQYIEPEYGFGDKLLSGLVTVGSAASVVYMVANDITGVGAADDTAIVPMLKVLWDNATIVLS